MTDVEADDDSTFCRMAWSGRPSAPGNVQGNPAESQPPAQWQRPGLCCPAAAHARARSPAASLQAFLLHSCSVIHHQKHVHYWGPRFSPPLPPPPPPQAGSMNWRAQYMAVLAASLGFPSIELEASHVSEKFGCSCQLRPCEHLTSDQRDSLIRLVGDWKSLSRPLSERHSNMCVCRAGNGNDTALLTADERGIAQAADTNAADH